MKRSIIFSIFVGLSLSASAFSKTVLADSLTAYCKRQATVGKVKVTQVKVYDDSVAVFVNHQLSTIPLSEEGVAYLYEMVSQHVLGKTDGKVRIFCEDKKHEISSLVTSMRMSNKPTDHYTLPNVNPLTSNASIPYSIKSGLWGKHIALYGSHGIYFNQSMDNWTWQRARLLTTAEDLYTTSYTMMFLAPMLENAGAVVIQPRERDTQLNEIIVDNTEAVANGEWQSSKAHSGWGHPNGPLLGDDNPFYMGDYTQLKGNTDTTAYMLYTPAINKEGEYAVYISYKTVKNSSDKVKYTVCHKGTQTCFYVNQQMGGSMWVYLGTFSFGTNRKQNYVRVEGPTKKEQVVTSDAIRFGGGWGSVARFASADAFANVPSGQEEGTAEFKGHKGALSDKERTQADSSATISGFPRWMEGARYWMQYSGVPESIYNYTNYKNDYVDDYACRGKWINWLAGGSAANPEQDGQNIPVTLGLAFHTDAGNYSGDNIVGTLMIYTDYDNDKDTLLGTGVSRHKCRDLGDYMQTQIVEDIRALYAPEWERRMLNNSSYAESRHPVVPTVLLELLSHQNFADMKYGLDPRFRFDVSRAIYKGMLKFIHEQYETPYIVQPLPVKDFAIAFEGEQLKLSWNATDDPLEPTARPDFYIVYTRTDEGDWDNGKKVSTTNCVLDIENDKRYDYKVCAGNEGGISFPSEILSAFKSSNETAKVLIVNGFTRISAPAHYAKDSIAYFEPEEYAVPYMKDVCYIGAQYDNNRKRPWVSDDDAGFGSCYSDKAKETEMGNTFDYPVMHGKVLAKMGISYISCSASSLGTIIPAGFDAVDLIMGKQKETSLGVEQVITDFKTFTPALQTALRNYQGALLCSGSFIGSDMQSATDTAFTAQVLHYKYRTYNATRSGELRLQRKFSHLQTSIVREQNPDVIPSEVNNSLIPQGTGARVIARYEDSGICAGVAYEGDYKQLLFGFTLESVRDFEALYTTSIQWLLK